MMWKIQRLHYVVFFFAFLLFSIEAAKKRKPPLRSQTNAWNQLREDLKFVAQQSQLIKSQLSEIEFVIRWMHSAQQIAAQKTQLVENRELRRMQPKLIETLPKLTPRFVIMSEKELENALNTLIYEANHLISFFNINYQNNSMEIDTPFWVERYFNDQNSLFEELKELFKVVNKHIAGNDKLAQVPATHYLPVLRRVHEMIPTIEESVKSHGIRLKNNEKEDGEIRMNIRKKFLEWKDIKSKFFISRYSFLWELCDVTERPDYCKEKNT